MEGMCMKQALWSLPGMAEWWACPARTCAYTYRTPFRRINKHCWVPLKCNCAFWPEGCLACHPVTSKLTAKIMPSCEGELKRSGSLINSCHGPLKIFSQQPGKRGEKLIIITDIHEQSGSRGGDHGHWCEGTHSSKSGCTVGVIRSLTIMREIS